MGSSHIASLRFGPDMTVERFRLGNGLSVLVVADHRAPVVCYQTWFSVGSRHERVGKTGIAHLFEHLMFSGTSTRPHGEFDRVLEEAGAESNAATYLDWTYYVIQLPRDAIELVVGLEADRMQNLVLQDEPVARERDVVANERRQTVEDDVDSAVSELLYSEALAAHPYRWPTIGTMEDIRSLTTEDCRAFYRTHYAPGRATVVVVGDVEPARIAALLEQHYGAIPPAEEPIEDSFPEPPQTRERHLVVRKPTSTSKLVVAYHAPAFGDVDHAPLVLLNEILFGGRSSRVHRKLVQQLEIASLARGYVGAFRDPALWDLWLHSRGSVHPAKLLEELDRILEEVTREPVGESELTRARARIELGSLQGLETVGGKATQIGFCETVLGDPAAIFTRLDAYARATRSDLLRVARRYLVPTARTVLEVLADGSSSMSDGDGGAGETPPDEHEDEHEHEHEEET